MTLYEQTKAAANAYVEKFAHHWKGHEMDPLTVTKEAVKGTERVAFIKGAEWERQRTGWHNFGTPPPINTQIVIMWEDYPMDPIEIINLNEDDLKNNWTGILWAPLPEPAKK